MTFRFASALALIACLATPTYAEDVRKGAVSSVIGAQIQAFQTDDFAKAFEFASPMIQGMFGSADRFGIMVRNGYPMVWRPADVRYGDTRADGGLLFQKVVITDQSGVLHVLEYEMILVGDTWQINGVQLLRPPQVGA